MAREPITLKYRRLRVVGPPGTGKTTWIKEEVDALQRHGVDPERIVVLSFSKAAALEVAARTGLPKGSAGTIHAFAYRAIGGGQVFGPQHLQDWNRAYPYWRLTLRDDDPGPGDALLAAVNLKRNRMEPIEGNLAAFYRAYRDYLKTHNLIDFTDMLELSLGAYTLQADVVVVDEAQDLTPLQWATLQSWLPEGARLAIVGDPYQAIYSSLGADGKEFSTFPVDHELVLSQSWRIPQRVHHVAAAIAARMGSVHAYHPRPEDGEAKRIPASVEDLEVLLMIAREAKESGLSVLILTSAHYLLDPVKEALVAYGVPYVNPYTDDPRLNWGASRGQGSQPVDIVRAFMAERPSGAHLKLWGEHVVEGVFAGGYRAMRQVPDYADLWNPHSPWWKVIRPEHRAEVMGANVAWLAGHLRKKTRTMQEVLTVAAQNPHALFDPMRYGVMVGTIHSVKGGEADVVLVAPDYTPAAGRADLEAPGALHRLYYVATTRAKKVLYMLAPASDLAYRWPMEVMA